MTDITIPPEALEAGKDTAFSWLRSYMEDDVRVKEMTDEELTELVGAACLAMLNNWPGMHIHEWQRPWLGGMSGTDVILPLLAEDNNDKG